MLELLGIATIRAAPLSWRRRIGRVGQGKDACRLLVIQRFPAAHYVTRKKDDGRAGAPVIGLWAAQ